MMKKIEYLKEGGSLVSYVIFDGVDFNAGYTLNIVQDLNSNTIVEKFIGNKGDANLNIHQFSKNPTYYDQKSIYLRVDFIANSIKNTPCLFGLLLLQDGKSIGFIEKKDILNGYYQFVEIFVELIGI